MLLPFSRSSAQVSRLSPLFVIPAKAGTQRSANGKTEAKPKGNAINQNVPDLVPAFAGMTKSAIVFWPQCEKLIKNLPTNSFKEPKKSPLNTLLQIEPFSDFFKRLY
jgi:hypothetical protein